MHVTTLRVNMKQLLYFEKYFNISSLPLYHHVLCPLPDDAHYFQELLRKIENPRIRNAAKEVYIARERLEIGTLLGKGKSFPYCFFSCLSCIN